MLPQNIFTIVINQGLLCATLPHVWGKLAHVQRLEKVPFPSISYLNNFFIIFSYIA
jgi:hypothetical protein